MSNPIHSLAQRLTGQTTLEESSLDDVKRIVQRYPFFAPAQFLLLQKLRQSGLSEEAESQYKKAVLFYPDPLAFEIFISSGKFYGGEADEFSIANIDDVPQPPATVDYASVLEETNGQTEPVLVETEENLLLVDSSVEEKRDDQLATKSASESHLSNAINVKESTEENSDILQTKESIPIEADSINILSSQPVKEQSTEAIINEPPVFEPYHTVDYFASQGIKISADELPKDKLSKQLKSFTEWLKTMKRLPASQAADTTERLVEIGVENMASRSVSDSEVLTEAMAEVWAKQGSTEKALDIYNKLSLHNPSKRDYFAAKIENLKPS